ncbi:MAG TPA: DUF3488 and transglutaminase-like domain-containing protein [Pirellulales bacterium]|nr:DUF3488 and transglutaminase-like domain-containing protein [Pirellulales bacterium]
MKFWRQTRRPRLATFAAAAPRKAPLSVERLLQINIAVLVPLGTMMLGMGDQGMTLAAVVLVASVSSIFVTDRWGWIRLNRVVANIIALVATVVSFSEFVHAASGDQLLAIANLLVYLQVVLLFQRKTVRRYWQLLVLSGLEVVVATAINLSLLFGVLLVMYLFVALATLGLICILREAELYSQRATTAERKQRSPVAGGSRSASGRWPLPRGIEIIATRPPDLPRQILGAGILWRTASIGAGTLVVAMICFLFLPRFGKALTDATGQQATVGYNPTVKLGDLGPLLENPEIVMQVEFRDAAGELITPASPPLLRGSLVNHYQQGEWKLVGANSRRRDADSGSVARLSSAPAGSELIRERITIQPMRDAVLFGVYPPYRSDAMKSLQFVRYDLDRQQLVRIGSKLLSQEFEYEVLTTGLPQSHQSRIVPKLLPREHEMDDLLQLPDNSPPRTGSSPPTPINKRDQLSGLRAFAAQKVREFKIAADDHYAQARLLERVLALPPFEYALDRPPAEPGIDPIEDFVTRNPRGHCEYFASALTLMLRSQGIPARMVIGYRSGDWNSIGSFYDVRQLHAHAWVEAYLNSGQIKNVPENERPAGVSLDGGAWLVLDPTPAAQANEAYAPGTFMSSIAGLSDYIQVLWNTYVVGLNSERQDKAIYQPVAEFGRALEKLATNPSRAIGDLFRHLKHWLSGGGGADGVLDWYVLIALVVLAFAAWLVYRLMRLIVRISFRLIKRRRTAAAVRSRVEFFRRFEALLARHGIRRAPGQTQLELAHRAAARLTASFGPRRAAALPARIVSAFYRVRFGHATLDAAEALAVEQMLTEVSKGLGIRGSGFGGTRQKS